MQPITADPARLAAALGLASPWRLTAVTIAAQGRRRHVAVAYDEAGPFTCSSCAGPGEAELDWARTWYHPDFVGVATFLHTRQPDLGCERCGIVRATVSWETPTCGFVLLTADMAKALVGVGGNRL